MTEQNEVVTYNKEEIVKDTPNFMVVRKADGKFGKIMKYEKLITIEPQTIEEKKELFSIMNEDDNDKVVPMKDAVGMNLEIVDFFTSPYESLNEDTGATEYGVTTTIKSTDGMYYVTSSKSVYYSLLAMVNAFGMPHTPDYVPIAFTITSTKQQRGNQINIKLV